MFSVAYHVRLFVTLWTVARQVPLSVGFSRQEYWSRLPCPLPGDLSDAEITPGSPALQADCLPPEPPGKPLLFPSLSFILLSLFQSQLKQHCWFWEDAWSLPITTLSYFHPSSHCICLFIISHSQQTVSSMKTMPYTLVYPCTKLRALFLSFVYFVEIKFDLSNSPRQNNLQIRNYISTGTSLRGNQVPHLIGREI